MKSYSQSLYMEATLTAITSKETLANTYFAEMQPFTCYTFPGMAISLSHAAQEWPGSMS